MKRFFLSIMVVAMIGLMKSDAQILISKVDPAGDLITITNYGAGPASVTATWQFCSNFGYISFATIPIVDGLGNFPTLPSGASVTFKWNGGLNNTAADLGLYNSSNFGSAAAMEHFVQWGSGGNGRENVAVAKGIWTGGTFLTNTTTNPGPGVFGYNGAPAPAGVGDWMNMVNVTLSVDMSFETVNAAGVHVAGSFQGWNPGSTPMTDIGNNCWEHTFCYPAGANFQYKYINGNMWGQDESVTDPLCGGAGGYGTDRTDTLPNGDVTIPKVCFGTCNPCIAPISLTLYVDMSKVATIADTVHVAGSFNGFNPAATPMTHIGDSVYCVTVSVIPGSSINYKFINGNSFNGDEPENVVSGPCAANNGFGDRTYNVPLGIPNDTISVVCFNSCFTCDNIVNLTLYVNTCLIDSVSEFGMFVGGTFNNFDAGVTHMADSGNGIWCATVQVNKGDTIRYKFNNGGSIGGVYEIGDTLCGTSDGFGDRIVIIGNTDVVLDTVCWNECDDCVKSTCPVPTGALTNNIGFFSANLTWDVMANSVGYQLQGGLMGSNPNSYVTFDRNGATNNSLAASGLTKNTSYEWQVRNACLDAQSQVVYSDWTPLVFFSTLNCAAPNPSSTTNVTSKKARLNWTIMPNSIGYIIRGQAIGGSVVTLNVPGGSTNFLQATGLTPNTSYAWAVTNVCSTSPFIESQFSQSMINNFTTLPSATSKVASVSGELFIYPNPADNMLNILNLEEGENDISLYDLSGKLIMEMTTEQSGIQMEITNVPAGIYQIVIENAKNVRTEKLIISK
ncbi:MAG: T9SS type A sorting domain-containing protein [Chitinophagales bacterium]|nr:T9SS type A sorting domain-containing protein [Chitinophagales bacterium]